MREVWEFADRNAGPVLALERGERVDERLDAFEKGRKASIRRKELDKQEEVGRSYHNIVDRTLGTTDEKMGILRSAFALIDVS